MSFFGWPRRRNDSAERVTAYVDGELSTGEAARFEAEVRQSPDLGEAVEAQRALKSLLRSSLNEVPAPRSFALTPEMVRGLRPAPARSWFPAGAARVAQATAAVAIVGFVTLTAIDLTGSPSDTNSDATRSSPASMEAQSAGAASDEQDMSPGGTPVLESPEPPLDDAARDADKFRADGEAGDASTFAAPTEEDDGFGALRLAQVAAIVLAFLSVGVFFVARRQPSRGSPSAGRK